MKNPLWSWLSATWMVGLLFGRAMSGQKKSVHTCMKVKSQRMAAAGRAAGAATCQKMRIWEHPSMRAASTSSSGTASTRYCRMKKTPKAVTSHGMITDVMLPVQPNSDIRMNMGTTPSWVGTAMVAITKTSSGPRPRKRSLAKA